MSFKVYIFAAIFSFILSTLLTVIAYNLGYSIGALDKPDFRKVHTYAIPRIGGAGIFLAIVVSIFLAYTLFAEVKSVFNFKKEVFIKGKFIGEVAILKLILGIFFGSIIIFIMGFIDDLKGIKAGYKILIQIIASYVAIDYGVRISGFFIPSKGYVELPLILSQIVTVLFIVSFVNAFNLIDGLDGLAAGITAIIFFTLFLISITKAPLLKNQEAVFSMKALSLISIIMFFASISFLFFNFHPARIFLGDCGSNLLGFIIATVSISFTTKFAVMTAVFIPFIISFVPFLDTFLAFFRRLKKGHPISTPDKKHIHHMLLKKFSHREAVLIIYNLSFIAAMIGLAYSFLVIK
ncbi:MAG: undecaprenyl/decaprenyl-phosphate alpha-N-acetylglucosaminyl 1-phosphate transferase [bacterium]|nr:undecaprenyl/decaprenyl-phosphate alpha-N-acetylglucosaminyl 1-phosphate transferase [bacterium]